MTVIREKLYTAAKQSRGSLVAAGVAADLFRRGKPRKTDSRPAETERLRMKAHLSPRWFSFLLTVTHSHLTLHLGAVTTRSGIFSLAMREGRNDKSTNSLSLNRIINQSLDEGKYQ